MNIYRINLNLLKVFAVLMQERHVTAAAKRLFLTQSAISNSLKQLRELFNDELLIRSPKKMVPTQKALSLLPQVEKILRELETIVFYSEDFEYQTSTRTFHLGMIDYMEYVVLPKLYEHIKDVAPHISLKVKLFNDFLPEDFESQQLELGIGLEKKISTQLISELLFSDEVVCVGRKNHPLLKKTLTMKDYLQVEHLAIRVYSEELSYVDQYLHKQNLTRRIKLSIPDVLPALQTLTVTDLIGTFAKHLAKQAQQQYKLDYCALPFTIPKANAVQVWHKQQNNDSGLLWLRTLIKQICDKHFSDESI